MRFSLLKVLVVILVSFLAVTGIAYGADTGSMEPPAAEVADSLTPVYNRALEMMESQEYDTAIAIFEMLGEYKDSIAQIAACKTGKNDLYYESAKALLESGQYDAAAQVFSLIKDHRDSEIQIILCNTKKQQAEYDQAKILADNGNYEDALFIFNLLGDFSDSENQALLMEKKIKDKTYLEADVLMSTGEYEQAIEIFQSLSGYEDSAERIKDCQLAIAKAGLLSEIDACMSLTPYEAYEKLSVLAQENQPLLLQFDINPVVAAIDVIAPQLIPVFEAQSTDVLAAFLSDIKDMYLFNACLDKVNDIRFRLDIALEMEVKHKGWDLNILELYEEAITDAISKEDPETTISYIQQLQDRAPDAEGLTEKWKEAYTLLVNKALGKPQFVRFTDVDLDGQEEILAVMTDSIVFYKTNQSGITPTYTKIEFQAQYITDETGPAGQKYMLGRGYQNQLLLITLSESGPSETFRADFAKDWELTETGIKLHNEYTKSPLRYQDIEYILINDQAIEIPSEVQVDFEKYPVPKTPKELLDLYADAVMYQVPEELDLLEHQLNLGQLGDDQSEGSADEKSGDDNGETGIDTDADATEALREWFVKHGKPESAEIYLWNETLAAYECLVYSGTNAARVLIYLDSSRGYQVGGLLDEFELSQTYGGSILPLNEKKTEIFRYNDNVKDEHIFRLYLPESGSIDINFKHDYIDNGDTYYSMALYPVDSQDALWWTNIAGNRDDIQFYTFFLDVGYYDLYLKPERQAETTYDLYIGYTEDPYCEKEWNNSYDTATLVEVNRPYHGSLAYDGDVDIYGFTLDEPGEVQFQFNHEYFDNNDTFFRMNIRKNAADESILFYVDINGKTSGWISYPFYLDAGNYYIYLGQYNHTARPYEFNILYTSMDNIELEPNNTFSEATSIDTNIEYFGSLAKENDQDFYVFTLDEPGKVQLNFKHEYFDNGDTFYRISLYDDATNEGRIYTDDISGRNSDYTRDVQFLDAGTYYFNVSQYYWTTIPYQFTWSYTPMENIERERNDTYSSATFIETNKEYNGSLVYDGDIDYYTFTLNEPSEIEISFGFTYFDNGDTFFKLALDTTPNNSNRYYAVDLSGRDNDYISNPFYLPSGTYYFSVWNYYWTPRPYIITVHAKEDQNCELEWNNTYETATPISLGQSMHGSLRYDGDVDIYRLEIDAAATVSLYFEHEWFDDSGRFFTVSLDAQPNNSQRLISMGVGGVDSDIKSEESATLSPGIYYIVVEKNYYTSKPYTLTVK